MSGGVGRALESLGLDICDLSFDWLATAPNTKSPLLWLCKYLTSDNILTAEEALSFAQLQEDEILTDDQLNLEFDNILKNGKYPISNKKFNFAQEKKKVDDLNQRINQSTDILETLEKSISQGLNLSSKFDKQLEQYKKIRDEKYYELSDTLQECEDAKIALQNKKVHVKDTIDAEAARFIALGKDLNNQINEEVFEEYFDSCDRLCSFFHNYIKGDETTSNFNESIDENKLNSFIYQRMNFEPIDTSAIIKSSNKLEKAINNYIKSQAERSEIEELLKFYLKYDENNDLLFTHSKEKKMMTIDYSEKEIVKAIKSFVKDNTIDILYGDIKLKTLNMQYILEELNLVQSSAKSMLSCSSILLSSLKYGEEKKDKIIDHFYSAVKTLIYDIVSIQDRRCIVDNLKLSTDNLHCVEELSIVKKELYKLLQLDEKTSLESVLQRIDSDMNRLDDTKIFIFNQHFKKKISQFNETKNELAPLRRFIWDGSSNQPNILNKTYELRLYELEQEVEDCSAECKKVSNIYKNYHKSSLDSFSTTLKPQ